MRGSESPRLGGLWVCLASPSIRPRDRTAKPSSGHHPPQAVATIGTIRMRESLFDLHKVMFGSKLVLSVNGRQKETVHEHRRGEIAAKRAAADAVRPRSKR